MYFYKPLVYTDKWSLRQHNQALKWDDVKYFYNNVNKGVFLGYVTPVFTKATEDPSNENIANLLEIARKNTPNKTCSFFEAEELERRRILGHTLNIGNQFSLATNSELKAPANQGIHAIKLRKQDAIIKGIGAKGIGAKNVLNAALKAMEHVIDAVKNDTYIPH